MLSASFLTPFHNLSFSTRNGLTTARSQSAPNWRQTVHRGLFELPLCQASNANTNLQGLRRSRCQAALAERTDALPCDRASASNHDPPSP